jgi:DNA-binding LacI/PurR family transcriptional regulator
VDLSESGAQIDGAPALQAGTRGSVALEALPAPVPFVVRTLDHHGALHVQFDESEAVRAAVSALLKRLLGQHAA